MGWQPHRNPRSQARSALKQESGSEAKPDSEKAALNSVPRIPRMLHMLHMLMETALRGASGGWVTGCKPAHITAFAGAKTLVENEKGWFDHPFFSLPNTTGGCNASTGCNRTQPTVAKHPRVATETQPAVAMHLSVAIEHNPRLQSIHGLQSEHNQRLQSLAFYRKK